MASTKSKKLEKLVKLDGRTGEGGGQVVRIAMALAALTGTPVRIDHVRGNSQGLKAQHASAINYLAEATTAEVTGSEVGSKTVEFEAILSPAELINRNVKIDVGGVGSVMLVFQSIFPFLLFAGNEEGSSINVTIRGGTNVSFSLSYEYLDQVLLPSLERFGVSVGRKLEYRGWSHGGPQSGSVKFEVNPLPIGHMLKTPEWPVEQGTLTRIDISIIAPPELLQPLRECFTFETGLVFPNIEIKFVVVEASNHKARIYTLLVAHTSTALRFGRDWLYDRTTKNKSADKISTEIAQNVVDQLDAELRKGGLADEYLQDQLIIFQALAEGSSSIPGSKEVLESDKDRIDRTVEPFGDGSTHTTTARWVTSQLLPDVNWKDSGRICEGIGWKLPIKNTDDVPLVPTIERLTIAPSMGIVGNTSEL
ncbi:RNA 3'-terminal phosphate cyclase-domain-containing protein [Bisporella sp. PMI_857]|nr:RNA 3'-terminal phosphate cyclase-domain-containing protein [Bisporella sp. PMI_857]